MRPVQLHISRVQPGDLIQKLNGTRRPAAPIVLVIEQRGWHGVDCLDPDGNPMHYDVHYDSGLFRRFNKRRSKDVQVHSPDGTTSSPSTESS
jgi:hypothetical protein